MSDPVRGRIVSWATVSSALLAVSLLLPGAVARGSGEVGSGPLLLFMVPFAVAAAIALGVLYSTLGRLASLPAGVCVAGILPSVLVAAVAALVLGG